MSNMLKWDDFFIEKQLQLASSALDYPAEPIPAGIAGLKFQLGAEAARKPFEPPVKAERQPVSNASQLHRVKRIQSVVTKKSDMDMTLEEVQAAQVRHKDLKVVRKNKFAKLAATNRNQMEM